MSEDSFTRTDDEDAFVIDNTAQNVSGGSGTAPITVQAQKLIEDLNELARNDAPQDKLPDMILHQLCTLFSRGYESGKRLPAEVRLEIMEALGMWLRNCTRVGWEFSQHKWFTVVRDLSFSELEALLRPIQSSTVLRELEFHDRVGVSNFTSEIYTSEFWALIADIIRSAENLEVFRASSVGMSVTGLSLIAEAFTCRYVSNLVHLDLTCNPIGNEEGLIHIAKVLGAARYLKRLVLSGTCMDMAGAKVLGEAVTLHHKLEELVLDLDTESSLIQARDTQVESDADSAAEEDCESDKEEIAGNSVRCEVELYSFMESLKKCPIEIDCSLPCGTREEHLHLVQLHSVLRELDGTSAKCGRVVLCGAHLAGKSQLAHSFSRLEAPWYKRSKEKVSRQTPASQIQVLRNDESLQISVWDLPEQDTFSVLQELLFPKRNRPCYFLFIFSVYDHETHKVKDNLAQSFENECLLWLSFIASNSYQTESLLLEVIVVMTYKDKTVDGADSRWAMPILRRLQSEFRGVLNIFYPFFVNGCERIDAKRILDYLYRRFRNHLRSDLSRVPKVCCQMCRYMLNWTSEHKESPVMTYQRFLSLCKTADSTLAKFLNKHPQVQQLSVARAIASYLHDVGIVIQLANQDILVVNPNWFMQVFMGRMIGVGRGYWKACEENFKRPTSRDGFLLKSEFQALVTERILQPLTKDTDERLDFNVLQTLMESLDLCYELFDGVRESRFFVPTLVEVEERSPLLWDEKPVLGAVSYLGVRIHREDMRIACFSTHTFSKFQMTLLRRMKQNLSEIHILVNDFKFNLISILCDGHDVLVENEKEGRFIDILVKSEHTKESIWMFIEKHILGELEKFCASTKGPPVLKLVVDVLRTDCVKHLTPIAKRENQSVSRELLKTKLKESIRNQGELHVSLRDLYVHKWTEVADTNLQQKAEPAIDILPLKDVEEIGEWIKSESQEKLNWMNSHARSIPDINGIYANLGTRIALLQSTLQKCSTEAQRGWKDHNEKLQSTVQEVERPVRDGAENWEEEMISNILKFKMIHTMWQEWCTDLFQEVDHIIGVLELNPQSPRRPYFSTMMEQKYTMIYLRIISSASVGEPMIINFACENRKRNHIVDGQHGLKINVEKENIEWIQEIVGNSAIAIDCLVRARLLGSRWGSWIEVESSTHKIEANYSASEKAYKFLLQHLRYTLRNQFPEYFGLYPTKYVDLDSYTKTIWLCKECRDKGEEYHDRLKDFPLAMGLLSV